MVALKESKKLDETVALQSDVASFASSLGFPSSGATPSAGFNDADFRKKGLLKPRMQAPNVFPQNKPLKENASKIRNKDSKLLRGRKSEQPPAQNIGLNSSNSVREDDIRFKNLPKLPLVKANVLGVWYNDAAELEGKVIGDNKRADFNSVKEWNTLVEKKRELGQRLLVQYTREYDSSRGRSGDIKMLVATQRSGTAADKVSALSVMVGDNPIANLRSIDAILGMVTSKIGKRHALTAFEVLKELFITLLPDRKLKILFQRPLNHLSDTKDGYSLLLFWYWEECLKERYGRFVSALEEASGDVLDKLKNMALKTMYSLLSSKSEEERRILSSLVNKLGDPENKVASNADYHLKNLLSDHPNMKAVVIDEVDNFLFRPRLGLRAKYHAVNFLSQIRLSSKGDGLKAAKRLIDIYFALFKVLISEASTSPPVVKHGKEDRKTSKSSKVNKPKGSSNTHVEMDSRLLSALLTGVNRAFRFVSSDETDDGIEVHAQLLFQLEEMFIGLLLRSMKNDVNIKRVAAFSKRLLQVALQLAPQYACGCLFMLSEVLKARPPLWKMVLQNETAVADEDLEHFEDVQEDDDNRVNYKQDKTDNKDTVVQTNNECDGDSDASHDEDSSVACSSEYDSLNESDDLLGKGGIEKVQKFNLMSDNEAQKFHGLSYSPVLPSGYNPRHREPAYCNAELVGWWELTVLASHVHPSVAAMARTLLSGVHIVYNGIPLKDLSLGAFLDKFMEKKPRESTWHGASQIEPAKKLEMNHQLIGAEIISLAEADVPPEDVVFHKFYMNKMNSSKKHKKKKKKTADDEASEEIFGVDVDEDESENEEIDNLLDSGDPSLDTERGYDYEDLDKIINEDDEDLIGDGSDEEMNLSSDVANEEIVDAEISSDEGGSDVAIGEADDGNISEESFDLKTKKRKTHKSSGVSPFVSLEDYQHLMDEDDPESSKSSSRIKRRKSKKRKDLT
ncbi:CCAAT/enhancer-binding protein zeta [Dorcoceras hygrometricum]|uniref:CCAAT/enhancer-binding protein zeta n=1 Tax=Dorcoceras hygrometricum TaxID=472368 RepID=A0A2Z7A1B1_9LAMI|nr:CCAAT/enhancer-binding protein zeta [Dorcoceras hygrometricum]